jgi:hypothetical protein
MATIRTFRIAPPHAAQLLRGTVTSGVAALFSRPFALSSLLPDRIAEAGHGVDVMMF